MTPLTIVSAIAALGGLIGAILATFKLSPERQSIFITTAQGAVVVQAGVIDDLRDELAHLRKRIDDCERVEQQVAKLRGEMHKVTDRLTRTAIERDRLRLENTRLQARVSHLEEEVETLKGQK